jgi:RNA polymerase sigma-70 factor (ECF subfamily)
MTRRSGGDAAAWEAIYRDTYPRLFAYCRRRLASDHDADDAVAEAMVRAVAGRERYVPGPAGVEGWLFGICHNVVRERWRATQHDRRWEDLGPALVPPAEDGPLERVLHDEERARVTAAFARLDPDERDLLELRVTGGLDAAEVGRTLGKRPGAVRMAQARALARLRTFLEEVT